MRAAGRYPALSSEESGLSSANDDNIHNMMTDFTQRLSDFVKTRISYHKEDERIKRRNCFCGFFRRMEVFFITTIL